MESQDTLQNLNLDFKVGLFEEFQGATKLEVPVYLQNLLIANGLDSEILLKDITDSDIAICEEYCRTVLHKNIPQHEYKNFYGPIYCYDPSNYQMVLDHKKIIFLMKDFFQNKNRTTEDKSTMTECAINSNYYLPSKSSSDAGAIQNKIKKLDIDLTQENKHIFAVIRKWVEIQRSGANLGNLNFLNNIKVCASKDTHDEDKMMCIITCFCRTSIKILKVRKSINAQPRWIYTNFYTHFKRKHSGVDPKLPYSTKDIQNESREGSSGELSEVPEEVPIKKSSTSIKNYFIKLDEPTTLATTCVKNPNSSSMTGYSASRNFFKSDEASDKAHTNFDNCYEKSKCRKMNSRINLIQSTKLKRFIPVIESDPRTDFHLIQEPVEISPNGLSTIVSTTSATSSATSDEHIKLLAAKISGNTENLLSEQSSEDFSPSKWATCKYSREERSRRKREKCHDNQTLLTNFYPILQEIHSVIDANINNNPNIVDMLNDTVNIINLQDENTSSNSSITQIEKIVKTALEDALNDAKNLEMEVTENDRYSLDIKESKNLIDNSRISTNLDLDHDLDLNLDEPTDSEIDAEISRHQDEPENNLQKQISLNDFMLDTDADTEDKEVCVKEDAINLKDFSYKNMKITENSPFIKINLPQNKSAVIKKSSYCWLLSDNNGKVSSDRLKRFIFKWKSEDENSVNDSKYHTLDDTVNVIDSDTEDETYNNANDIVYDDSTDTETFSDLETEKDAIEDTVEIYDETVVADVENMHIDCDCYYAVFYDEDWFIGKVLEKIKDKFKITFLKKEHNKFVWPEKEDIAKVEQKYIFYGPITLSGSDLGSDPFQLKRVDFLNIKHKIRNQNEKTAKSTKRERIIGELDLDDNEGGVSSDDSIADPLWEYFDESPIVSQESSGDESDQNVSEEFEGRRRR
ncbi:unnamed protein product [Ceutorhynchus assimilis]|uniref:Uncharacterized protein n=1 Tax=Ceutorhynchus assimilis TaxID=467358 RepID=A0A9N9MJY0_9CUCU|nr:unnamed protein product [Ceutorhynchus assimilis]